jgi:hypothetical protein
MIKHISLNLSVCGPDLSCTDPDLARNPTIIVLSNNG